MSSALDAEVTVIMFGQQHVGRLLFISNEVGMLSSDRQFLFLAGQRPVVVGKPCYYADCEFTGWYDQV